MVGEQIAHYVVTARVGAGGMGEVYRARDTKLGREVALKVIPRGFAQDIHRMSRFHREAQVLASLNHPHIATIHGLEESGETCALVMEFVEGETLSEWIIKNSSQPSSMAEALSIARQIAEGLEYAHEKGIIHRDLKPANIKLTPEGKVKLLDFGLAKAMSDEDVSTEISNSPTVSLGTQAGVILGTAAYMSPEQARGKPVDKRTDVWAFGCVLYELLSGKRAFAGETTTDVLGALLHQEPDWTALPSQTPHDVRATLQRCFQKDRARRLRDIGDAQLDLSEPALSQVGNRASSEGSASRRKTIGWGAILVLVAAAMTLAALWSPRSPADLESGARLDITIPADHRMDMIGDSGISIPAFSPDGTLLAFVSNRNGIRQIYVRRLNSFEVTALPGTQGAEGPFFSPDSKWLGFVVSGKAMKVATEGGAPLPMFDTPFPTGNSWAEDGSIVSSPGYGVQGLVRIPTNGGAPKGLTKPNLEKEEAHRWPQVLPGGKAVLYTSWSRDVEESRIVAQPLTGGAETTLIHGGWDGRYVPTGHILYVRNGTLYAVRFDAQSLKVLGTAIPVLDGIAQSNEGVAHYSFSQKGTLAYLPGEPGGPKRKLVWVDRTGREEPVAAPAGHFANLRLSAEGKRAAYFIEAANDELWSYDFAAKQTTRHTFHGRNMDPIWTPDGKKIAFRSNRDGARPLNIFLVDADGSGSAERLTTSEFPESPCSWTPDGQFLSFWTIRPETRFDLWVLPMHDRTPFPLVNSPANELWAEFSPDGRWVAYVSDESGRFEIYLQPFPGKGGKRQISTEGGSQPVWSKNGRELFFRNGHKVMAVEIGAASNPRIGPPRLLFEKPGYQMRDYDVAPDGRFLMIREAQPDQPLQIRVVVDWFEELKRKVPAGQ